LAAQTDLTSTQLLLMLELCSEAEHRCDQRLRAALGHNDFHRADSELQLKEKYSGLKRQLFESMKQPGTTTDDLHQILQNLPQHDRG
jgi:hypothetical protein